MLRKPAIDVHGTSGIESTIVPASIDRSLNDSYCYGMIENCLRNRCFKHLNSHYINISAKDETKLLAQSRETHEGIYSTWQEIDDDVNIACCRCIATSDRSEEPGIAGGVACQRLLEVITVFRDHRPNLGGDVCRWHIRRVLQRTWNTACSG